MSRSLPAATGAQNYPRVVPQGPRGGISSCCCVRSFIELGAFAAYRCGTQAHAVGLGLTAGESVGLGLMNRGTQAHESVGLRLNEAFVSLWDGVPFLPHEWD